MFYYLGRKKRLAKMYPEPSHDLIIEPFAGSGAYSLHGERWKKDVLLNDLSPVVSMVWRYLLQAKETDILSLPDLQYGDLLSDHMHLSDAERWLISFHINPGANQRSNVVTRFNRWPAGKKYIVSNLHKIKHWGYVEGDYRSLLNLEATWFIDPPYQSAGHHYMTNTVSDYQALGEWCLSRNGQIIVCEQDRASWLNFVSLASIDICGKAKTKEAVYLDHNSPCWDDGVVEMGIKGK